MTKTKQDKNLLKYNESEFHILIRSDQNVIEAAADVGKVELRQLGKDHVAIISGKQLKEIDRRKLKYELWTPRMMKLII